MLMIVNFISPDGRYDDIYLSNFATIYVKDELLRVDGVSDINYMGQRDYSIRVWLDPQKLASRNMTATDVADAIRSQNIDAPAGADRPAAAAGGQAFQLPLDTLGRLADPEQFGDIIVKVGAARAGRPPDGGRCRPAPAAPPRPSAGAGAAEPRSPAGQPATPTPAARRRRRAIGRRQHPPTTGRSQPPAARAALQRRPAPPTAAAARPPAAARPAAAARRPAGRPASRHASAAGGTGRRPGRARRLATSGGPAAEPSPRIVRLRDVARVELGGQNYNQSCTFDGKPSVGLGLYQLPGTNALDVADRVRAEDGGAEGRLPRRGRLRHRLRHHAVHPRVDRRRGPDAARGRRPGRRSSCCVFLQNWRATILPHDRRAGRHPRHVRRHGGAGLQPEQHLAVRAGAGHRHRRGRRHRRGGEHRALAWSTALPPREADRTRRWSEVTGPIVAIALVLCAVFVPCAFISGITGQFFRQFARDHRRLDGLLGDQLADAQPGPGGHPAEAAAAARRDPLGRFSRRLRSVCRLRAVQPGFGGAPRPTPGRSAGCCG